MIFHFWSWSTIQWYVNADKILAKIAERREVTEGSGWSLHSSILLRG